MSDPPVDLDKGITGLKEEKGFIGLKEEDEEEGKEKFVHRYKHLKVMCVVRLLDMIPVVILMYVIVAVVEIYRTHPLWCSLVTDPFLLFAAILMFSRFRKIKEAHIQRSLGTTDNNLSTTLLASTPKGSKK